MSLTGILFLVFAIIALFTFIYFVVVTARNWGVLHTLLLCFLFIECWCFLIFSAGVIRNRVDALKEYAQFKDEAEGLQDSIDKVTWGDPNSVSEELDSVVAAKSELRRVTMDRGRIWRRVTLIDQVNDQVRLQLAVVAQGSPLGSAATGTDPLAPAIPSPAPAATAQPAPAVGPAVSFESLPVNMVVYGFAEAEAAPIPGADPVAGEGTASSQPIPNFYLGEFVVVENQAGQVVIRPTAPLEPSQVAYVTDGKANSWTLYELLPLDGHHAFAAPGSKPSLGAIFGRMDEGTINQLFASVPTDDSRQQKLVAKYLRDGQRAADDDPPESVWVRVELLKEYEVDVDSPNDANATIGGYYDSTGRSIDVRMKRGEGGKVRLAAGKQLVLSQDAANDLINKQVAKLIERIFVRPLNAYEEALNRLAIRRQAVIDHISLNERDKSVLATSNGLGQAMIAETQVERQLLSQDLAMYQKEQVVVRSALEAMVAKLQLTKSELSQRYREIHARHAQMSSGQAASPSDQNRSTGG